MSIEDKQNFLRENILKKGYDGYEFQQFLENKKGNEGANIENWDMSDLITVK